MLNRDSRQMSTIISWTLRLPVSDSLLPVQLLRSSAIAMPELSSFQTVGIDEMLHAIRKSPSKQCSSDPLPTWLLEECTDTVALFLAHLLNLSLVDGHFPSPWKHAIITRLLKKACLDDSNVSSYRPVSNLLHVSKILERIVNHKLIIHLDD